MNTTGIVQTPDPVLRAVCAPVVTFDDEFRHLAALLIEAASKSGRAGVAAPQIGLELRMFAFDHDGRVRLFVNPSVVRSAGEQSGREGCLSVAERFWDVTRAQKVTVQAQDVDGRSFTESFEGHLARVMQHETDHLDGVLVVDRVAEQIVALPRQQRRAVERELAKVRLPQRRPEKAAG